MDGIRLLSALILFQIDGKHAGIERQIEIRYLRGFPFALVRGRTDGKIFHNLGILVLLRLFVAGDIVERGDDKDRDSQPDQIPAYSSLFVFQISHS